MIVNYSISSTSAGRFKEILRRPTTGEVVTWFAIAVLGFSFWFFMAVPFASHRESYSWLAGVHNLGLFQAFSVISVTYRPFAQGITWLAFEVLNPSVFPTSVFRQAVLQGVVYGTFVAAWWLVYTAAAERRLLAIVACIAGGVFYSGYVHLFHLYGLFYVPVMLMLGMVLRVHSARGTEIRELWMAVVAIVLAFWHPFATALFLGFYFGFYIDTFWRRNRAQHVQAVSILAIGTLAIAALVFLFPRADARMSLQYRILGTLASYRTNEVNTVSTIVAFLLAQMVVLSTRLSRWVKLAAFALISALGVVFLLKSVPLLLLWHCAVLWKLIRLRSWSLFFLMFAAVLFPFGGGIGAPVFALFAIVVAVYVTPLGWSQAEHTVSIVSNRYAEGLILFSAIMLLAARLGVNVPVVTKAAAPLLAEREKTFQLENILAWLHQSEYCGDNVAFAVNAGSPTDSLQSAMNRRNRPPSDREDVQLFWNTVLRCNSASHRLRNSTTAVVTFGGQKVAGSKAVFYVKGKYADNATVWIPISPEADDSQSKN